MNEPIPLRFEDHPDHVRALVDAALAGADARAAVVAHWPAQFEQSGVVPRRYWVIAAGKASAAMTLGLTDACRVKPLGGVVVGPPGVREALGPAADLFDTMEADHPIPTERNILAAKMAGFIARRARDIGATSADPVGIVALISGGASAHLTLPSEGVQPEHLSAVTLALMRAGATIDELNAVRKHCERLKGGGLARLALAGLHGHADRGRVLGLAVSDVVGDRLGVIGSGPTAPDESTFADALAVLERYALLEAAPSVTSHIRRGFEGALDETLKPGDPLVERISNRVILSNSDAVEAVRTHSSGMGFGLSISRADVRGEAREFGRELARYAAEFIGHGRRPVCVVAGGETTVRVKGGGAGGRNLEIALAAAIELDRIAAERTAAGEPTACNIAIATFATDGVDGVAPPDKPPAAGAMVSAGTCTRGRTLGLDPAAMLDDNNSYAFFDAVGGMLRTGLTGANVNDIAMALIY